MPLKALFGHTSVLPLLCGYGCDCFALVLLSFTELWLFVRHELLVFDIFNLLLSSQRPLWSSSHYSYFSVGKLRLLEIQYITQGPKTMSVWNQSLSTSLCLSNLHILLHHTQQPPLTFAEHTQRSVYVLWNWGISGSSFCLMSFLWYLPENVIFPHSCKPAPDPFCATVFNHMFPLMRLLSPLTLSGIPSMVSHHLSHFPV